MSPTFTDQIWATCAIDGASYFRIFLLLQGEAIFSPPNGPAIELVAPQMLWAPFATEGPFRLLAGGGGAWILASEDLVWRVVADSPLLGPMRSSLDHPLVASPERMEPNADELKTLFGALARESANPGPGAMAMGSLYLGLVMTHLWRASGLADRSDALHATAPIAQRFRQLVEMHYRENLSVQGFSGMLGVTRAHLHSACTRALGRSPQRVVHDRLIVEARLRLRQSSQPVEHIAYSLGFRDAAYFNRFFRRLTGMTPGAYRKTTHVAHPKEVTAFEAWP